MNYPEMTEVLIPISRKLYDDIIRLSDGQLDPVRLANYQLEDWLAYSIEDGNYDWGERWEEAAKTFNPHFYEKWLKEQDKESYKRKRHDLVWKKVTIPHGSEVRMNYKKKDYYAKVEDGSIIDGGRRFSPSEWAKHIASGTSRNAWRDLHFKFPNSKYWVPAEVLRRMVYKEMGIQY